MDIKNTAFQPFDLVLINQQLQEEIAERKKAEEALRQSEEDYRKLFEDHSAVKIIIEPETGNIFDVNHAAAQFYGWTREELRKMNIGQINILPLEEIKERIRQIKNLEKDHFEFVHRKADGTLHDVEVFSSPITMNGVKYLHSFITDITERKQTEKALQKSEERYRSLLTNLEAGIVVHAPDTSILMNNPRASELLGLSDDQLKGRKAIDPYWKFINENYVPINLDEYPVNRCIASKKSFSNLILGVIQPAKDVVWLTVNGFPAIDKNGELSEILISFIDITKRKLAEEKLTLAHDRLRSFIDLNIIGVVIATPDGKILETNDYFLNLIGFTRQEFEAGKIDWIAITPPEWIPADEHAILEMQKNGTCAPYEKEYLRPDGTRVAVLLTDAMLPGPDHQIVAFVLDITDRKKAEDELRLKNLVFDASIAANSIADLNGKLTQVNNTFLKIWNYPDRHSVIGRSLMDFLEYEDEAVSIVSSLNENYQWEGDYTARRMDGSTFIAHGQASVVRNEDGQIIGYQSAVVDVTQRKQTENALRESEDRFRKVFEEGSMGMAMSSLFDGTFMSVNKAFCNMLGYTEEELMQLSFATVTHPDFRTQDLDAVRKMIDGEIQEHFTEKQYIKKNGDAIWVTRALTKIYSADGKSFYALALINDITDRKQAEEDIKKLNETLEKRVADRTAQLEAVNKELEAFSYSVSHDLRAPLRHISGFSEMLTKEIKQQLPEKSQHFLDIINNSAQKMGILIDDLLSFSRTGRAEMNKTTFDMSIAVEEARLQIKFPIGNRIIKWNFVNLPYVFGDYNLLLLVWINLLDNAVKYTSTRDEAIIRIDFQETSEEFIFCVSDNGVGFDMQYANKLFGVFQRLHSIAEFEGTGIGLANVRRIILRHGGRTWAEAKENEGASFYFTLPKN